jgi:hypothetical protein
MLLLLLLLTLHSHLFLPICPICPLPGPLWSRWRFRRTIVGRRAVLAVPLQPDLSHMAGGRSVPTIEDVDLNAAIISPAKSVVSVPGTDPDPDPDPRQSRHPPARDHQSVLVLRYPQDAM